MTEKLKQKLELLKTQLAADKKKAAVLGILAIVLVCVIGRLVFSSSGPDTIMASTAPLPTTPTAPISPAPQQTVAPTVVAPVQATPAPPAIPAAAAATDDHTKSRSVSVAGMPRELARDLFASTAWNRFLPADFVDNGSSNESKTKDRPGFWGHLRRSLVEYEKEQGEFLKAFNHDLEQLVLQSTMTGIDPMAYISGRLVRQGDVIDGFSVVRISDREVTLARAGMTATLAMR